MQATVVIEKLSSNRYQWRQYSIEGEMRAQKMFANLTDCPAILQGEQMMVLLPGEEVTISKVNMPKTKRSELKKLLPFALEDQVADDIEKLNFVPGEYDANGKLAVAILAKKQMQGLLEALALSGHRPNVITPVYLMLPFQDNCWSLLLEHGRAHVRTGEHSGFSIELENLLPVLKLKLNQATEIPASLRIFKQQTDFDVKILNVLPVKSVIQIGDMWARDVVSQPVALNLLPGRIRQTRKTMPTRRYWMSCVIAAGLLLLVLIGGRAAKLLYYQQQAKVLSHKVAAIYKSLIPGGAVSDDPRSALTQRLTQLQGVAHNEQFFALLSRAGSVLHARPEIDLRAVSFQGGVLTLKVQAKSMQQLESFARDLIQQGLLVKQTHLQNDKQQVAASLRIRRK